MVVVRLESLDRVGTTYVQFSPPLHPRSAAAARPTGMSCSGGVRLAAAAARRVHSVAARGRASRRARPHVLPTGATALVQQLERAISDRDARLAAAERDLQARLADKDARLADKDAAERELQARLADKDARLADKDARLADKDARLADKDALMKAQLTWASSELATSKYNADVASGILNVRELFEACLADIWRACGPSIYVRVSTSQKLAQLLSASGIRCPGLLTYLHQAAADNGLPEEEVLQQARKLYEALSLRVHADVAEGTTRFFPAQVIDHMGGPATVALAAFVRFTGRDISLYGKDAASLPLRLRRPPLSCPCSATAEELQRAPLLGPPASGA